MTQGLSLGSIEGYLRFSARYVGSQRLSFDPALDRSMGSYVESRLEALAKLEGGLRISVAADNLLGGTQDSFAFGNPLRFSTTRQFTPRRPASLSAAIAAEF